MVIKSHGNVKTSLDKISTFFYHNKYGETWQTTERKNSFDERAAPGYAHSRSKGLNRPSGTIGKNGNSRMGAAFVTPGSARSG
jgi:hypothetical protein